MRAIWTNLARRSIFEVFEAKKSLSISRFRTDFAWAGSGQIRLGEVCAIKTGDMSPKLERGKTSAEVKSEKRWEWNGGEGRGPEESEAKYHVYLLSRQSIKGFFFPAIACYAVPTDFV